MSERRTVFLAAPYGQVGGGMGSIMAYLSSLRRDPSGRFELKRLETRGGGHIALSPLYLALAAARIAQEGLSGRLAVTHLNLAERGSIYRKAAMLAATKLAGGRVLLHLHAAQIVQHYGAMNGSGRALVRWMFRSADHVVVLGDVWRRWVADTFQVRPGRISVVYNGVPATAPRPRTVPADGRFRLLFVGNLLERKGVADLLRAVARPELRARDMELTMAGGGPVETYRALAAELGIAERVTFTGWVSQDDARTLMVNADALALPAYDEGLPLVILEALASGTPVICTPVGSIPEVLEDRATALMVPPGNEAAIAAAVTTLIDRPELGRALSAAGADLYERLFTMEAFARSIGALYAQLAPGRDDVARPQRPVTPRPRNVMDRPRDVMAHLQNVMARTSRAMTEDGTPGRASRSPRDPAYPAAMREARDDH
jgi:glycosyltransferase involved in cell wall biosynthesis